MNDQVSVLRAQMGQLRQSEWILVDQAMIDDFADVTRDRQFIHVDPQKAAATPFGGTIAHGFLVLSLLSFMQESISVAELKDIKMGVNYGFDRVRFISPVRSGSRIRTVSTLIELEERGPLVFQLTHDVLVEIEGGRKPAMKAVWITRLLF